MLDEVVLRAYNARHKEAFLAAFDVLRRSWPPENTVAWWEQKNDEIAGISYKYRSNPLSKRLMVGVWNYLGKVAKGEVSTKGAEERHKHAFRTVMDFVNDHFRAGELRTEDVDGLMEEHGDDALCAELIRAVREYLEEDVTSELKEIERVKVD